MMGSYGIGIERILTCSIEIFHDKDGIALPHTIAPFSAVITPVNYSEPKQREAVEFYIQNAGMPVLMHCWMIAMNALA